MSKLHAKFHLRPVLEQFQRNFRKVSEQFQSSFRAVLDQFKFKVLDKF